MIRESAEKVASVVAEAERRESKPSTTPVAWRASLATATAEGPIIWKNEPRSALINDEEEYFEKNHILNDFFFSVGRTDCQRQ